MVPVRRLQRDLRPERVANFHQQHQSLPRRLIVLATFYRRRQLFAPQRRSQRRPLQTGSPLSILFAAVVASNISGRVRCRG